MSVQSLLPHDKYRGEQVKHVVYCYECRQYTTLILAFQDYHSWRRGQYVQDAFYYLTPGQRELIISGTHIECFDKLFKKE